jgi:hypothetical protein
VVEKVREYGATGGQKIIGKHFERAKEELHKLVEGWKQKAGALTKKHWSSCIGNKAICCRVPTSGMQR